MSNSDLFLKALKKKFRFTTPFGVFSTEDLFGIQLSGPANQLSLDRIALDLYKEVKSTGDVVSFVNENKKAANDLSDKLEIVKEIIAIKKENAASAAKAAASREQRQRVLELIQQKENGALSEKSIDELKALLKDSDDEE